MSARYEVVDRTGANWPDVPMAWWGVTFDTRDEAARHAHACACAFAARHGKHGAPDLRVREVER